MLNWFYSKLIPASLKKDDLVYSHAKNLVTTALIALFAVPGYAAIYYFLKFPEGSIIVMLIGYFIFSAAFLLNSFKSLVIPRVLIVGSLFLGLLWLTYKLGGIYTSTAFWFILPPLLSVLLGGIVGGFFWAILGVITIVVFYFLHFFNFSLPANPVSNPLFLQASSISGLISIILFLAYFYERARKEAYREIQTTNKQLRIANNVKRDFLENMSHELLTPLNGIIGFAQLIHDEKVPETSVKELSSYVLLSSNQLLQIVNDMLDFSQIETGKLEFKPEYIDFYLLQNEIKDFFSDSIRKKELDFEILIDQKLRNIFLDPARFKQVIYHYLSNAVKFTPNKGKIILRIFPIEKEKLRIEVEDTGIGVTATDLKYIFIPFKQLSSGMAKKFGGTGLGLTLVRRIVEAQGGKVGVEFKQKKGSTFYAELPRRFTTEN